MLSKWIFKIFFYKEGCEVLPCTLNGSRTNQVITYNDNPALNLDLHEQSFEDSGYIFR